MKEGRKRQRERRLTLARARHRAGGLSPVKANYTFIKGEGPPPVSHLPDPVEPTGFTAEPERMRDLTMKDWMGIYKRWGKA